MPLILEFVRPHGWLPLVAMLLVNHGLSYRFGGRVLLITIPVLGLVYGMLDFAWIREEMAKPEWDGAPDQDAVFLIGMMLRVLIGSMLLIGSCIDAVLFSAKVHEGLLASEQRGRLMDTHTTAF